MTMTRRRKLILLAPLAVAGFALFIALGGYVVMKLWNALLPELFGWKAVSFWQALGLLALCRILFGGLRMGGPHHRGSRHRSEHLTSEERERFRERLHERFGIDSPSAGETSPHP
jgi:hypothetical protein